jgi:uncharacterized protein
VRAAGQGAVNAVRLAQICRHPVKAIGYETVASVRLRPDAALPHDRRWAVAHAAADLPAEPDGWASKLNFLRGVAAPDLMAIAAQFDEDAGRLTLRHPRAGSLTVFPDAPADAARLIDWLRTLWPESRPAPARLVQVPGQALTDRPEPYVSILSLTSNRILGRRLGCELSIHRWRGNLWLDGLAPWEEFDLVGREITVGPARLWVERRITRCKATTANPETGRADVDTLGALEDGYGHHDFGVYARVVEGGEIAVGEEVVTT